MKYLFTVFLFSLIYFFAGKPSFGYQIQLVSHTYEEFYGLQNPEDGAAISSPTLYDYKAATRHAGILVEPDDIESVDAN